MALGDAENEQDEPRGHENGAKRVEALAVLVHALGEQERREDESSHSDGHVDEEDPLPGEEVDEDAAEEDTECGADATHGAPGAEGDVALAAFLEGPDEDRERCRRDRRRSEPLERAECDQRRLAPREPAQERAEGEEQRAGHEDTPAAEKVRGPSSQEEESSEHERVGADHPLQVLLREPEVDLDRRQRDVDDRDVEDGHELHREDERECEPLLPVRVDHGNPRFQPRGISCAE